MMSGVGVKDHLVIPGPKNCVDNFFSLVSYFESEIKADSLSRYFCVLTVQ